MGGEGAAVAEGVRGHLDGDQAGNGPVRDHESERLQGDHRQVSGGPDGAPAAAGQVLGGLCADRQGDHVKADDLLQIMMLCDR